MIEKIECIDKQMVGRLKEIIEADCEGDEFLMYEQFNRVFVKVQNIEGPDLMLRVKNSEKKVITIANISFRNKRKGSMTKLINLILENGYGVRIECAMSEEIFAFMKKGPFLWEREKSYSPLALDIGSDYKLSARKKSNLKKG